MGAVIAGAAVGSWRDDVVFNCGDSRVYRMYTERWTGVGKLTKVSHDHSVVQHLFDEGRLTEDQMRTDWRRGTLTAAIGTDQIFAPTHLWSRPIRLRSDDALLICSDGVWEALTREQMEEAFYTEEPERKLLELLRGVCCDDNVSFIVLRN
ncbi:MAG: hypothetical protein J6E31_04495 [Pyramidobacter sp.]|nr:hypothetical protein [Pyramidobacter sp.]